MNAAPGSSAQPDLGFRSIAILGAGNIGISVAEALAIARLSVVVIDLSEEVLRVAQAQLSRSLRAGHLLGRREGAENARDIAARVQFDSSCASLPEHDFVIENVTENLAIKRAAYETLGRRCDPRCLLAANTSPERVIGMHFMNPVPQKPTVEVVRGYHTSDTTVTRARQFLERIGKHGILVEDGPGFVSNRILMLTINEAAFVIEAHISNAEDTDRIFRECFGHTMGPLATADLIGLDTILNTLEVLSELTRDAKFRPCPLLRKLVDAGLLGRKSGRGFFEYD